MIIIPRSSKSSWNNGIERPTSEEPAVETRYLVFFALISDIDAKGMILNVLLSLAEMLSFSSYRGPWCWWLGWLATRVVSTPTPLSGRQMSNVFRLLHTTSNTIHIELWRITTTGTWDWVWIALQRLDQRTRNASAWPLIDKKALNYALKGNHFDRGWNELICVEDPDFHRSRYYSTW